MKALVTGGAGFIGSHLCELLINQGHEVIAIDNLRCGRLSNVEPLNKSGRFKFIELDIRDNAGLKAKLPGDIEWVFHLAGMADIVPSIENPREYYEVNVSGTFNMLEWSVQNKVQRFVYAASSSCYGLATEFPTPETAKIAPEYPYALSKYLGEELVLHWAKVYGLKANSLRLFNVYGPRSRTTGAYGAVFGVFLAQKLHNKPYTVVGDGRQSRDFTYVTDVARAFLAAAMQAEVSGQVMNVGSGGHYTVNSLVALLEGPVVNIPKRPGEPDITFADTKKIKQLLQWEPQVKFADGVAQMLSRINDWQDAPVWDAVAIEKATKTWFENLGARSA